MKTACFVPIKVNSERVPGKNLREFNGKKLYTYICEHIKLANVFDDVYVDTNSEEYDSCFTAIENHSFYWYANMPVNYRPGILPRSQDMLPVIEKTTGLYGISSDSLKKYKCRIGRKPYMHIVNMKL